MGQNVSAKVYSPAPGIEVEVEDEVKALTTTITETLFLSAAAGIFAETCTYPLDLLKTRHQAFLTLDKPKYKFKNPLAFSWRNLGGMALDIIHRDGVLKLWDGLTPALIRQFAASGLRTSMYEKLRNDVFGKEKDKAFPLSLVSGSLTQLIVSPMDLIKILCQTDGHYRALGQKSRATGILQVISLIVKKEGVLGLWRGSTVNMNVAILTTVAGYTSYDECKQMCIFQASLADNYKTHIICSLTTSYITTLLITPLDVIKTRIMNQSPDKFGRLRYASGINCFWTILKEEGFWALYSGFWPQFLRLTPWYLLFWVGYEQARHLYGKESF